MIHPTGNETAYFGDNGTYAADVIVPVAVGIVQACLSVFQCCITNHDHLHMRMLLLVHKNLARGLIYFIVLFLLCFFYAWHCQQILSHAARKTQSRSSYISRSTSSTSQTRFQRHTSNSTRSSIPTKRHGRRAFAACASAPAWERARGRGTMGAGPTPRGGRVARCWPWPRRSTGRWGRWWMPSTRRRCTPTRSSSTRRTTGLSRARAALVFPSAGSRPCCTRAACGCPDLSQVAHMDALSSVCQCEHSCNMQCAKAGVNG